MRLYDIGVEIDLLLSNPEVLDADGVLSEAGEKALDELHSKLETRVLDVAAYLLGERAEAEAVASRAHMMLERAQRHENRAKSLESYLRKHLTPGSQRIADARAEVSWRKSSAVEVDETKLPDEHWRVKTERSPNRTEIGKLLREGKKVPGAELVSRWNLSIR